MRLSGTYRRGLKLAMTMIVAVLLAWVTWSAWAVYSGEGLLDQATSALAAGRCPRALALAEQTLAISPDNAEASMVAGRAAAKMQRWDSAIQHLDRAAESGDEQAVAELWHVSERLLALGLVRPAEEGLRRLLQHDPDHLAASDHLVYLLKVEGRLREARPLLRTLLARARGLPDRQSASTVQTMTDYLRMTASTDRVLLSQDEQQFAEMCHNAAPSDFLPYLGQAREHLWAGDLEVAETVFRRVSAEHPDLIEAQVGLGAVLLETARVEELREWHDRLPSSADSRPEVWYLRGAFAERYQQDLPAAARCYYEAVRRHPGYRRANYKLAQVLRSLGRSAVAEPFAQQAARLARLEHVVQEAAAHRDQIPQLVALLRSLGRLPEAYGWVAVAEAAGIDLRWAEQQRTELRSRLPEDAPLVLASANPARLVDLSDLPLPSFRAANQDAAPGILARPSRDDQPCMERFEDEAASAGLVFSYFNGADASDGRAWMFEFSGGGVAVLDLECDGWPDVYLTQGCDWPPHRERGIHHDCIFRNKASRQFEDVTRQTGLGDTQFSMGAAVGDFDSDGFDDVYVANIGANRLYRNNGDGTFSESSEASEASGGNWTISSVLADLNGDTLPDIYAVNYLSGDVLDRVCTYRGRPVQCLPTAFPGAPDELFLNLGDGTFAETTRESGLEFDGKGMGIVAADVDGSGRLSLFVANDTTPNFLLINRTPSPGGPPRFEERGLLGGVALGADGAAESSMGIAAGDANDDHRLDLFVTNYYREPNNLYVQTHAGQFQDRARSFQLSDSGYHRLGWGAQFVDGDLDGDCDLIVANGHLEDYSDERVPYRMPTVYYRNEGGGRFIEVPRELLGGYLAGEWLGRAVARIDWDRDGREDILITHVDAPVALLTNRTRRSGSFVRIRLVGVRCERCAFGARVRVKTAKGSWTRDLLAGDGFAAANQRQILFGLGPAQHIDSLTVTWPSGQTQAFGDVAVNQQYTIIEGEQRLWIDPD